MLFFVTLNNQLFCYLSFIFFFLNIAATPEIYTDGHALSLHDARPIWIGRYVERADDTARILDVHVQALSEDPWADEATACRSLLAIMDHPAGPGDRKSTRLNSSH